MFNWIAKLVCWLRRKHSYRWIICQVPTLNHKNEIVPLVTVYVCGICGHEKREWFCAADPVKMIRGERDGQAERK